MNERAVTVECAALPAKEMAPRVEIEFGWFTAHTIIQEHQGKIEIESEVGKGDDGHIFS